MVIGLEVLNMEKEDSISLMETITLEILKRDTKVVMAKLFSRVELNSVVFGKMTEQLDKGKWFMQMEINFLETFKIQRKTEKGLIISKVAQFMKELLKTTNFIALDYLSIRTGIFMMGSWLMGLKKDKEFTNIATETNIMEIGWLIKRMDKETIFTIVRETPTKESGAIT